MLKLRLMTYGDMFDTHHESGCVVESLPNENGDFLAIDSDGFMCQYNVNMVIRVNGEDVER